MQTKKYALVIITHKPDTKKEFIEFASTFTQYDVYVIIDDNSHDYSELKQQYSYTNVNFIQVENEICSKSGMKNTNTMVLKKNVSGWDKALYWFAFVERNYEYIWFSEDDVFFYNEETLLQMDTKYKFEDLLCNSSFEEGKLNEWLWSYIQIEFAPPYYCGMMCICRMSRKMIECLKDYAVKHNTVFFLEALFPTIAKKNNLSCISSPVEFGTITWQNNHELSSFCIHNLYHPMKNMDDHIKIRSHLKQKIKQKEKNKKQKQRLREKKKQLQLQEEKQEEQHESTEKSELYEIKLENEKEETIETNIDYEKEYEII